MLKFLSLIKRKRIFFGSAALVAILILFIVGFALTDDAADSGNAVCGSFRYRSVMNGMRKEEVRSLLGEPSLKRIKHTPDENFFYQGEHESSIAEGWIYSQKRRAAAAERYFGSNGHVNGKNCGQG